MIEQIKSFLASPCQKVINPLKSLVVTVLLVILVLFVSVPWGGNHPWWLNLLLAVSSGLATALAEVIYLWVLPKLFPQWYDAKTWTYKKELLSLLLGLFLIATFVYTLFVLAFGMPVSWPVLVYFTGSFIFVVPIILAVMLMWRKNLLLAKNLREANEMNELLLDRLAHLQNAEKAEEAPVMLTFVDGKNSSFELESERLFYAEANGNYVDLVFKGKDGVPEHRLIRGTMKSMEETCEGCGEIVRCHRAYLVNMRYVKMVTGNAQECSLHLEGCPDRIPVSRNCRQNILESMQ